MSEMVERVGRAIDPRGWETQDGLRQYSPDYWASETQTECRKELIARARRAIAAMREPTEAMTRAGWEHTGDPCWLHNVADAWRAMIDAAVGEIP